MSVCDDKQTMPPPYLDSSLYWTKKKKKKNAERSICILEKRGLENPGRTQRTAGVTLGKCDIVPQIKVNPSKATRFSLLLSVNSLPCARIQAQRPFVV